MPKLLLDLIELLAEPLGPKIFTVVDDAGGSLINIARDLLQLRDDMREGARFVMLVI